MHAAEFVASYFDAWNHGDPQGVADHLTADGIFVDVPQNMVRTHDELIVMVHDYFSDFPGGYELLGEILSSKVTFAFQYRACG